MSHPTETERWGNSGFGGGGMGCNCVMVSESVLRVTKMFWNQMEVMVAQHRDGTKGQ